MASTILRLLAMLVLQSILIGAATLAQAQPKLEMHRVGAKADDGSGWHLAVSSKGSFSVLLPIPFNDFTTNEGTGETTFVVGAKSSEGIKFSAVELAAQAEGRRRTSIQFSKSLRANAGQQGVGRQAQHKGEADILTTDAANATTTRYMRCIQLERRPLRADRRISHRPSRSGRRPTKTGSSNPSNSRQSPERLTRFCMHGRDGRIGCDLLEIETLQSTVRPSSSSG